MSAITQALRAKPSTFVDVIFPTSCPYLCQIKDAELIRGYWGPNTEKGTPAQWFLGYVPTLEILDWIPLGDPETDELMRQDLDRFGDWQAYKPGLGGRFVRRAAVPGYVDKQIVMGIANGLNFDLFKTSPNWESLIQKPSGEYETGRDASRFYKCREDGTVEGWVNRVLSTDPNQHRPPVVSPMDLEDVIAATKGAYLTVLFQYRTIPDGRAFLESVGSSPV